jgi:SAM-dependent methyltransferase
VVASYDARAPFARAETAHVSPPRLLSGLLAESTHVAELPCGTGHFLPAYREAGLAVTLVDANPAMLAQARDHAHDTGLPPERIHTVRAHAQDLPTLHSVDLMVVPNAALNQLACQTPLTEVLAMLAASLCPGTEVLVQVACTDPGGGVDTAGFYDPARPHRVWFADRWFDPTQAGGAATRHRCQTRDGDRLRIDFDYRDPADIRLHTATVEMALFTAETLTAALTSAGLSLLRFLPGQGGLSEAVATVDGGRG